MHSVKNKRKNCNKAFLPIILLLNKTSSSCLNVEAVKPQKGFFYIFFYKCSNLTDFWQKAFLEKYDYVVSFVGLRLVFWEIHVMCSKNLSCCLFWLHCLEKQKKAFVSGSTKLHRKPGSRKHKGSCIHYLSKTKHKPTIKNFRIVCLYLNVVFLGKTLDSQSTSPHPEVNMGASELSGKPDEMPGRYLHVLWTCIPSRRANNTPIVVA